MHERSALTRESHRAWAGASDVDVLRHYLTVGEQLLWTGKPDPDAEAIGTYLGCLGLGLIGIGGAVGVALAAGIWGTLGTGVTPIALAVMLIVPLGTVAGGLLLHREPRRRRDRAARSLHAITDRRLLTLIRGPRTDEIIFIAARSIGPVHLTPFGDGRGTITIETHSTRASDSVTSLTQSYAWFGVPDVQNAYALIAELQDAR